MYTETLAVIQRLGLHEDLLKVGFTNFKLRNAGRFDLEVSDQKKK